MLLPANVICARILADYDMLKFVIYIYIFFSPQLKDYNFKNTPIYGHLASRRLNRGYKQSEDTSSKALIEGNRLTT